jgi:hypothetical protein
MSTGPVAGQDQQAADEPVSGGGPLSPRPRLYISLLLLAFIGAAVYGFRWNGIFACRADDYAGGSYLSYCQATGYGDYDHGAFWYGLEPEAIARARAAQAVVLGNSRTQLAFSTDATRDWFNARGVTFYLLGFSHNVDVGFEGPLLQKLKPEAKLYIINVDRFFRRTPSPPARSVMTDTTALGRYRVKRRLQPIHRLVCQAIPALCLDQHAFFRNPMDGTWQVAGRARRDKQVSYVSGFADPDSIDDYIATARAFIDMLHATRGCIVLTQVPFVKTDTMTADTIAAALQLPLVAPRPTDLMTFDQSHLDGPSRLRWSSAFYQEAGPLLDRCLAGQKGGGDARP